MATIRDRGALQFQAVVKRRGWATQRRTFNTRREAERWARGIESAMDLGTFAPHHDAEQMSLAQAIERYRMEATPGKKGAKQESYKLDILLESPLAKLSLAAIRGDDVARYRDQRLKGAAWRVGRRRGVRDAQQAAYTRKESAWRGVAVSGATVRLELSALSSIFKHARMEWGMRGLQNPVRDVKMPPKGKARTRRLRDGEEPRLWDALADYAGGWAKPLAELAIETGMRRGEWINLEWPDVDLSGQTMVLHETKNGDGREVPLSTRAVAILQSLRPEGDSPRGRVLKKQPGTITAAFARSRDAARAKYVKECAREGVEADPDFLTNLHWHDLRHEATSRLFEEKGLNIMEVASVTGHKTLSMLKRYTHLKAQAIAKKLG